MFIVLLKLSDKSRAREFMAAHKAWITRGFDDGVFLAVGNLEPGPGGAIIAHQTSRASLDARVNEDPFVEQKIVSVEIIEIAPNKTDPRLAFLIGS